MPARADDVAYYKNLWLTQIILPDWIKKVSDALGRMAVCKQMYVEAARKTNIAWGFFACTHWLEASCDPKRQILNGQPFDAITTIEPTGKGPFRSWEDAALFGLNWLGVEVKDVDTLPEMLRWLERWNGFGYRNIGVNSPYLWSGTQHGVGAGKFIRDHVYSANAVSGQLGCAPILKALIDKYGGEHR